MSGRRINDHSFWAGGGSSTSVFAMGAKSKTIAETKGAGEMMKYPDTEELVHRDQERAISKIKAHAPKEGEKA